MRPISMRERETIVFHKKNKEINDNISKWTRVSVNTITRIWSKETGSLDPKPQNSGRKSLITEGDMNLIVSKIKEVPDITLREMIKEFKLPLSESALSKRLKKLGYTYKKRHCIPLHNSEKV